MERKGKRREVFSNLKLFFFFLWLISRIFRSLGVNNQKYHNNKLTCKKDTYYPLPIYQFVEKLLPKHYLRRIITMTLETRLRFSELNPFSATRRDSRHQNKVKVKGLGTNSSHLAGFSIFFHGSMKNLNQLAKKHYLKIYLSSIKTKVAIKFPEFFFFFFFLAKN